MKDAESIMLFGVPFGSFRSFEEVFRFKSDIECAHHIFRQFAREFHGDARSLALLYAMYQKLQRENE